MTDNNSIRPDETQDALNSIERMNAAGHKRGTAPRWHVIGVALIVTVGFALYAQQDSGNFPGLLIALAIALFITSSHDKTGAMARAIPEKSQPCGDSLG
ncbi:MAG: hypothetical protein ACI8UP_001863 [Porticoccaceae bacterium]|jgi:hypothetical protein